MADALKTRAARLLVGLTLLLERVLELLAALPLGAEQLRQIFRVACALPLEHAQLVELRLVLRADALLAAVDLREVARHADRLRVRLVRDADRLLQQLAEDLARHTAPLRRRADAR